jgi:hypothetical protein
VKKPHRFLTKLQAKAKLIQAKLLYNEYGGPLQQQLDDAEKLERLCWQIGKLANPIKRNSKRKKYDRFKWRKTMSNLALAT